MKQGLKKGITVLMISAMLASTSTVSYASEIENQNMAETMNVADTENPSPNANGLNTSGNQSDSISVNMNSQLSDDPVDVPDVNEPSDDDVDQYEGDENTDPSEETLQGWVSGDDEHLRVLRRIILQEFFFQLVQLGQSGTEHHALC